MCDHEYISLTAMGVCSFYLCCICKQATQQTARSTAQNRDYFFQFLFLEGSGVFSFITELTSKNFKKTHNFETAWRMQEYNNRVDVSGHKYVFGLTQNSF